MMNTNSLSDQAEFRRETVQRLCDPEQLWCGYVTDPNPWVREAVARNPYSTVPVLLLLAEDPEWIVRYAVALHPFCPPQQVFTYSVDDPSPQVRKAASDRLTYERERHQQRLNSQ